MALYLTPLINGKSYEHADITMIVMGVPIVGLTAIEYGEDAEIQNVYGTGRLPVSRTHGVITPNAKVTVLMEDVMNIVAAAPNGRIYDIPEFDVIVSFTDTSLIPVVHKIKNCRFKNNKITSKQGSDAISVDIDLVCSNIDWGV
jgi:hypothetical protein